MNLILYHILLFLLSFLVIKVIEEIHAVACFAFAIVKIDRGLQRKAFSRFFLVSRALRKLSFYCVSCLLLVWTLVLVQQEADLDKREEWNRKLHCLDCPIA